MFALLLALVPFGAALADHRVNVDEIEGGDDATSASVAWSQYTFDSSTEAALGRDDKFPDNLASSLIQGQSDAPLLLTDSTDLEDTVAAELQRLGVDDVHVLGGDAAIDQSVVDELEALGYTVHRDAGITRIETAIDIAATHAPNATEGLLVRAFGGPSGDETQAWADALAAGGWAAAEQMPVFLTQTEELNDNLREYLQDSDITSLTIVGGTAAVSASVEAELEAMGIQVDRVSGANRFATAVAVAEARGYADAGDAATVILSEGQDAQAWAGGFAAAAYSARTNAPIVLANGANIPPETETWLQGANDGTNNTQPDPAAGEPSLVCGPMVDEAACTEAAVIMGLGEASQVTITTADVERGGNIEGTLSNPENVQNLAVTGDCITDDSDVDFNPTTGEFTIPTTGGAEAGSCTLTFTVTYDDGQTETVTRTVNITEPATVTDEPELVSASTAVAGTDHASVRYVFDQAVTGKTPDTNDFKLYTFDADEILPSTTFTGQSVRIDPDNSNVVIAVFDRAGWEQATVAAVAHDAVRTTADGQGNPEGAAALQAFANAGGITAAPDLQNVTNIDATNDRATFVFDEAVSPTGSVIATSFHLVFANGATATGTTVQEVSSDQRSVTINFAGDQITASGDQTAANVRRGHVDAGAVRDAAANFNPLQSADVSGSGLTADPDLIETTFTSSASPTNSAARTAAGCTAFSSTLRVDQVLYRFDEEVTSTGAATLFNVYDVDGTEQDATCVYQTTDANVVIAEFAEGEVDDAVGASVEEDAVTSRTGTTRTNEARELPRALNYAAGQTAAPDMLQADRTVGATTIDPISGQETPSRYDVTYTFDEPVANLAGAGNFVVYDANGVRTILTDCSETRGTTSQVVCRASTGTAEFTAIRDAVLAGVEEDAARDAQANGNPENSDTL